MSLTLTNFHFLLPYVHFLIRLLTKLSCHWLFWHIWKILQITHSDPETVTLGAKATFMLTRRLMPGFNVLILPNAQARAFPCQSLSVPEMNSVLITSNLKVLRTPEILWEDTSSGYLAGVQRGGEQQPFPIFEYFCVNVPGTTCLVLAPPIFSCRIPPWFLFHLSPILQKLKMEWGSTNEVRRMGAYWSVLSKWEFLIKMRGAFLAPILPRVMKEGETKGGSSYFDETLSIR